MRICYPKSRNMTHALSLSVFVAFKGTIEVNEENLSEQSINIV